MSDTERSDYERMLDKADRIERALDGDPSADERIDAAYEAGFEAGYAKRAQLDAGTVEEIERLTRERNEARELLHEMRMDQYRRDLAEDLRDAGER